MRRIKVGNTHMWMMRVNGIEIYAYTRLGLLDTLKHYKRINNA